MRPVVPALLALVLLVPAFAVEEPAPRAVPSAIQAVTVYLDRALVSRTAALTLAPGLHRIVFQGLPSEIEDASLRLKISGGARLESLQARRTFLAERKAGAAAALEIEIKALAEQIQEQKDLLAALQGARNFLEAIQVSRAERLSKELGREEGKGPDIAAYRDVLGFLTGERVEAAARVRKANAVVAELEPRIVAKRRELEQLKADDSLEQKEVTAVLRADAPVEAALTLSYMLPGALWFPAYDVRAEPDADRAELAYYAFIQQATGEDWKGAVLTLSAARPSVSIAPPEPAPWYLTLDGIEASQQMESSSWNPESNLRAQYKSRSGDVNKKAHQHLLANCAQVALVSRSVERRSTSAVFRVERAEHIAADGNPHRVTLGMASLSMAREYLAVPRLSLNTYVTGRLENGTGLPLLPGTASVFVGADLIGTTTLDFVAPRETASVYLGMDETVKVVRELDAKESSEAAFSSRKRLELAYRITVRNFRPGPARLSVQESLPVSQDERVTVRVRTLKPRPSEEVQGVQRWDLSLAPGEEKEIRVAYTLEYPGGAVSPQVAQLEELVRQGK